MKMLSEWGTDIRIHTRPFHLPSTVRPRSVVIWQRPLPESWQQQVDTIRWIRDQGSILITEWDDHPNLFPVNVRNKLRETNQAALRCCHLIQTSNTKLGRILKEYNPCQVTIENTTGILPRLDLKKHSEEKGPRVFIGNQNRKSEHEDLIEGLISWCRRNKSLRIVVIQDKNLANRLPKEQVEFYPTCDYMKYRDILRKCNIAMMPLKQSEANTCKTPIKWIEAAAESVICIGGPELYQSAFSANEKGILVSEPYKIPEVAEQIWLHAKERKEIVKAAHQYVLEHHRLEYGCIHRLWIYKKIWQKRVQIDTKLINRLPETATAKQFKQ